LQSNEGEGKERGMSNRPRDEEKRHKGVWSWESLWKSQGRLERTARKPKKKRKTETRRKEGKTMKKDLEPSGGK